MDYNLRRDKIMDIVFARGSETVEHLAQEFGVSPRTILRDISAMSIDKPIFTKVGRGGGVFFMKESTAKAKYILRQNISLLEGIKMQAERNEAIILNNKDVLILDRIISASRINPNCRQYN